MDMGTLKQQVMKIYNTVNQEQYQIGVKRLRVDIIGRAIVIIAEHKRIPGLKCLDREHRHISRATDVALLDMNKAELHRQLEEQLGLPVKVVLKDYDPFTEVAGTIIVLKEDLNFS